MNEFFRKKLRLAAFIGCAISGMFTGMLIDEAGDPFFGNIVLMMVIMFLCCLGIIAMTSEK